MSLSRVAILAAVDIHSETVAVPEWGGTVIVRGLTGTERDAFEQRCHETSYANVRACLLAFSLVDDNGKRLFSLEDVQALGAKSAAPLDLLFDVARRLSGIGAREVKELVGNSEPGLNGATTSPSPHV